MSCLPRLILLPGLGVDRRLFLPQMSLPARIEFAPALAMQPGESLECYAERLSKTIDAAEPFYLGGVSFGGMLAQEMTRHLRPRAVFAIATCDAARHIKEPIRLMCHLGPLLSDAAIAALLPIAPLGLRLLGRPNREARRELLELLAGTDPNLTRLGAKAIAGWSLRHRPQMPIYRIHGTDDQVIPAASVCKPALLVSRAGHVVNVTHSEIVNRFIRRILGADS
jgi:pimeloyl-ACP methyl ester carboxylesterase